jgi:hypothetical protein
MKCDTVKLPNGSHAIVCGQRPKRKRCEKCGANWATRLCDWKLGVGKTCDVALCVGCTSAPAQDKDLCPDHAAEWASRQSR